MVEVLLLLVGAMEGIVVEFPAAGSHGEHIG